MSQREKASARTFDHEYVMIMKHDESNPVLCPVAPQNQI